MQDLRVCVPVCDGVGGLLGISHPSIPRTQWIDIKFCEGALQFDKYVAV